MEVVLPAPPLAQFGVAGVVGRLLHGLAFLRHPEASWGLLGLVPSAAPGAVQPDREVDTGDILNVGLH